MEWFLAIVPELRMAETVGRVNRLAEERALGADAAAVARCVLHASDAQRSIRSSVQVQPATDAAVGTD